MEDLEDELDLRYHRGLKPDVYYRCPTLESLDGALRNEFEKNASSLIPMEIATEFVFATASTITIPVAHQQALDALIEPADHMQSIMVHYALCRDIDGKDRLKIQRAVTKSIIETIQEVDGFKYSERSAQNKEGGDGTRLKYVCKDSLQNRDRKNNMKKDKQASSEASENQIKSRGQALLPTYDCCGAIYIKFSIKRDALNVVYKHNPIHTNPANGDIKLSPLTMEDEPVSSSITAKASNGIKKRKRIRSKKDVDVRDDDRDHDIAMSTLPEASETSTKEKKRKKNSIASPNIGLISSTKKGKETVSPSASRKKTQIRRPSPPPRLSKGKACSRCRQKKIKCNEAKPTCNQCQRGLWTCQYEAPGPKKRSKNVCMNCKTRKRKCTEERPSCALCLRLKSDCQYDDYL